MIIKSHIRGGIRQAADYLKSQGKNEKIRTVEISDPDAASLDEAFHHMWEIASNSRARKPLHHISINPFKDERLTDEQVLKIVKRCEEKYGYRPGEHQRVIVEHIKDGRQHFHVMWNRVSLRSGKVVKSGEHWKKSKQAAREMERELGLKTPTPGRTKKLLPRIGKWLRSAGHYRSLKTADAKANRNRTLGVTPNIHQLRQRIGPAHKFRPAPQRAGSPKKYKGRKSDENIP